MVNEELRAWLTGYVVLSGNSPLNDQQIEIIKNHANLVFEVDGFLTPAHQSLINELKIGDRLQEKI